MWAPALRWRRAFPGDPAQMGALRRWLEHLLPPCPSRDDVASVAVELCTNAVRHTVSGQGRFAVEVTWTAQMVRVAVFDNGAPDGPRVIEDSLREDGRGLLMVNTLSARRGVSGDARGRVVWADIIWAGQSVPGQPEFPDGFMSAIRDAEADLARRHPGSLVWFGSETWQWWALPSRRGPGGLVAASSPQELAQLLDAMEAARQSPPTAGPNISPTQAGRRSQQSMAALQPQGQSAANAAWVEAQACLSPSHAIRSPARARTARPHHEHGVAAAGAMSQQAQAAAPCSAKSSTSARPTANPTAWPSAGWTDGRPTSSALFPGGADGRGAGRSGSAVSPEKPR